MFTLKHVVVFFILQNAVSSFRIYKNICLDYIEYDSESSEYMNNDESTGHNESELCNEYLEINNIEFCPEDQSLISQSDIEYFIEEKAELLKIKENLVNSYYPKAVEIFDKYMGELKEFQKNFEDRPEHMLHILHDMASLRQRLEPDVEEIAAQLEQFDTVEDNFNNVARGSDIMLNQLNKYKNICEINCEEIVIENRFGHKINSLIVSKPVGMYCVRLKDLSDNIYEKLSEVQAQHDEGLSRQLEIRDEMYAQKMSELKINLKQAAVKQFGMTMYDILSLQDDYHHFVHDLEHSNISSEIYNIKENAAEIDFKLIGLKRDLEKYRQYCMKCNINQRVKRNVFDLVDGSIINDVQEWSDIPIPIEKEIDAEINTLDELIKTKIDQIKESINNSFNTLFEELDGKLDDPDVIDVYVTQLHPIQNNIENNIKTEQEASHRLRSRIPEASIEKILALSKKSKQIIQSLESTKQYFNQFISSNSI